MSVEMNRFIKYCLGFLLFLLPLTVYATSASFDYGAGEINKGSGGVGAAMPQDALAAAINPAAIAFVPDDRLDVGATLVRPNRGYSASGAGPILNGSYDSQTPIIIPPSFGFLHHINNVLTYAISVYGVGLNTDYDEPVLNGGSAGLYLRQIFTNFATAWKLNDQLSLGGSLIVATQTLKVKGLSAFSGQSNDENDFTNKGTDYSFGAGAKVGMMYNINPKLSFGASYQPEIAMSKLSKYAGLLPDAGSFNIPPTAIAGVAYKLTPTLQAGVDTQYIWYSAVPAYSNTFTCNSSGKCFGTADGSGFGWKNTALYKLGVVWHATPSWILRSGYVYSNQPIQSTDILLAVLAPATSQNQFTLGATHLFKGRFGLSGFLMYSPKKTVSGDVSSATTTQNVSVHLEQYEVGLSFTWLIGKNSQAGNAKVAA